jgi:hypothetical protein
VRCRPGTVAAEALRLVGDQTVPTVDHHLLPKGARNRVGCRSQTHDSEHSLSSDGFDAIGAAAERRTDNYRKLLWACITACRLSVSQQMRGPESYLPPPPLGGEAARVAARPRISAFFSAAFSFALGWGRT